MPAFPSFRPPAGAAPAGALVAAVAGLLATPLAGAGDRAAPATCVRGGSWQETMTATRDQLLETTGGRGGAVPAADGVPWDSGPVRGDGPAVRVSLDVTGVKTLCLQTETLQGTANCNIWGEPTLIGANGAKTRLTDLQPVSARVGWGQLLIDANWQKRPLCVGDRTFAFGIWVHAPSEVRYALAGRYVRFEAWCGEDRDRANGSVRFQVTAGETPPPPAHWEALLRDFPDETGWLQKDAGIAGALAWFADRPDARLEQDVVGRIVGQTGPAAGPLGRELDALRRAGAAAGDRRWLDLYLRARRARAIAAAVEGIADAPSRAPLETELASLAARPGPPDAPAWAALLRRALLAGDVDIQFASIRADIARQVEIRRFAGETFRPQSLILPSDRDPLDVVVRRTETLLVDLKGRAETAVLAAPERDLARLRQACADTPVADAAARRALFGEVCAVRRRIALANPLLDFDRILFIKRHRALYNHMCDQYYGIAATPGGGLYVLENAFGPAPRERDLLAGAVVQKGRLKGQRLSGGPSVPPPVSYDGEGNRHGTDTGGGTFLSPDLSWDGKTILFAYCENRGDTRHDHHTDPSRGHWDAGRCYHLFKVNADGTGLEQLTDGTWNDFDPCWLPNGRIAFISERRGGYLRCGRVCPNYNLYDMADDGSAINCLSFHETNEWHPSVTHDGRIVYTRWDYVDRHGCTAHHPWITTLDGRDARAVHGNFAPRNLRPDMELDVRAVPGSRRFVATAAPHHGQAYGSLILIDPAVPDDDAMGPVKRLTPEVGFPESQGGREAYGTPWPLADDYHLCVYDAEAAGAAKRPRGLGGYGIYLVDSFGNRELIHRDPDIACLSPIPLRPRPMPPAEPPLNARTRAPAAIGAPGEATVAVMNVYDSLLPWPEGTSIKALRVLQVLPMPVPSGGLRPHETGKRIAEAGDSVVPVRWVLGTVPVETDGSAHFTVPAYRELFFQALDERGRAVQSMRSATYLRDGEFLTCQGCHEPKARTPLVPAANPIALRRPPSRPAPDVDGSNPFSYPRLVQPVLDRHCAGCHAEKQAIPLGREPVQNRWFASYNSLLPFAFTKYGDGYRTTPGRFGARASRLLALLEQGHYDVQLPADDLHRLTLWLDCASMFYGVYEREGGEAQLRGEIARPTLE